MCLRAQGLDEVESNNSNSRHQTPLTERRDGAAARKSRGIPLSSITKSFFVGGRRNQAVGAMVFGHQNLTCNLFVAWENMCTKRQRERAVALERRRTKRVHFPGGISTNPFPFRFLSDTNVLPHRTALPHESDNISTPS